MKYKIIISTSNWTLSKTNWAHANLAQVRLNTALGKFSAIKIKLTICQIKKSVFPHKQEAPGW